MTTKLKCVEMYTDGACLGNPGFGGYGIIMHYNGVEKELSGGMRDTTNNRMELSAAIEGLKALKEPCKVILHTDSKYLSDSITKGWLYSWEKNDWKRADKSPVLNVDLWQELLVQLRRHSVEIVWVKGHNGHEFNERCDKLATSAAGNMKSQT